MSSILDRYFEHLVGILSCFDRLIITGTLVDIGYAEAMTGLLNARRIRIFDYTQFADPLREELRANTERLAAEQGLTIEYIRHSNFRKEERIKEIIRERGDHPGLVHIFSAMERCSSYRPWHDKASHATYLKPRQAQCLHYYFYFIDADLGLCYLRVPTWAPFRLQFYFNAHNWLARQLTKKGIGFTLIDNAFTAIDDFNAAQEIVDGFSVKQLHRKLDAYARRLCPVVRHFPKGVHWNLMQVEYATDIVFSSPEALAPLYEGLTRTAIHAVKADDVATFLGRKIDGRFVGEAGADFSTRIQGTRIRHFLGPASIKMYDKLARILRIETTVNKVDFFKHHRTVVQRDGTRVTKLASVRKTIHSLGVLRELLGDANRRYLEFLSQLDTPDAGIRQVEKISEPARQNDRTYRGFNLFSSGDLDLFTAMVRGEFAISGCRNRHLQRLLKKTGGQVSRLLKRLRLHGLIKKIGKTYKYYLTHLGRAVIAAALRLRDAIVLPSLGQQADT